MWIIWPGQDDRVFHSTESSTSPGDWFGGLLNEQKDASGLMYRRNRYYDPQTGRFTQMDPIGIAGGLNAYGFAEGDPVSYSDPYGLAAQAGCPPICNDSNLRHLDLEVERASNVSDGEFKFAVGALAFVTGGPLLSRLGGALLGRLGLGTATAATASESVLFTGTRAGLRAALSEGTMNISTGQAANLTRALGRGAVDNIRIVAGSGGAITATLTRAGRNGHQVLTKVIDSAGRTTRMVQTAYDKSGNIVHGEAWK